MVTGSLHDCPVLPDGNLVVIASSLINIAVERELVNYTDSKLAMNDFYKEVYIQGKFQCSYNVFMENLIDNLIARDENSLAVITDSSKVNSVDVMDCELDRRTTAKQTDNYDCHIPNGIAAHLNHTSAKNAVSCDANDITKVVGFLNHRVYVCGTR